MNKVTGLRSLLETHEHISATQGYSGVEVYYLPGLSAYLKIGETGKISNLSRERTVLDWLIDKASVPKVLGYESYGTCEALLISAMKGETLEKVLSADNLAAPEAIAFARRAASALRRLHEVPIGGCALDMRLDERLARSLKSIELGLLSESDEEFEETHGGSSTRKVYAHLLHSRPAAEDLVFTHGDPCMPNIMVHEGEISGFIDMDGAGVADRYVDIAIFLRSFRYNCKSDIDLESVFCDAYGLDVLEREKVEYYATLDDLF